MIVRLHFAVPEPHRQAFADAFSGLIDEASVPLVVVPNGLSQPDFDGPWWGASQQFPLANAEALREPLAGTKAWYLAINIDTQTVIESNLPSILSDASFASFIEAVGLALIKKPIGITNV